MTGREWWNQNKSAIAGEPIGQPKTRYSAEPPDKATAKAKLIRLAIAVQDGWIEDRKKK